MKKIPLSSLLTFIFIASPACAQAIESAYTDFGAKKCRHTPGKDVEDYGEWRCTGFKGIPVYMSAGDQRINISYGKNAENEPAASQTLASFNGEGDKIEWRMEKGKPFAAIMRWSTTKPDEKGDSIRGSTLVVTRLGLGGVCHVGYVDGRANKNANELAREIADQHARDFVCGKDKLIVLGEQGSTFSGSYDSDEK
jgi:hypothetical protein